MDEAVGVVLQGTWVGSLLHSKRRYGARERRRHEVLSSSLVGGASLPRVFLLAGQGRPAYNADQGQKTAEDAGQGRPAYKAEPR